MSYILCNTEELTVWSGDIGNSCVLYDIHGDPREGAGWIIAPLVPFLHFLLANKNITLYPVPTKSITVFQLAREGLHFEVVQILVKGI